MRSHAIRPCRVHDFVSSIFDYDLNKNTGEMELTWDPGHSGISELTPTPSEVSNGARTALQAGHDRPIH